MLARVEGKFGISATVLAYSRSAVTGDEFITFEIEYPRMILAELNTHRMLSRNSASSRAIPFKKMLEQLTARPVRFGEANPGMQDKGVDFDKLIDVRDLETGCFHYTEAQSAWEQAKTSALEYAQAFYEAGYHKQVYNRLVEPFQMMKTVISGTEWANFFWLRAHNAADPSIEELARVMWEAGRSSAPKLLYPGEWHLPYIESYRADTLRYGDTVGPEDFTEYKLEDAIKISCARSAAVSFRNVDYGLEKSLEVYGRLVGDERKHASAFEHQGTPMKAMYGCWGVDAEYGKGAVNVPDMSYTWEQGVSHADAQGSLWSGNLQGFIQYRKLIPGENKK